VLKKSETSQQFSAVKKVHSLTGNLAGKTQLDIAMLVPGIFITTLFNKNESYVEDTRE
jgi:hypothetical protein